MTDQSYADRLGGLYRDGLAAGIVQTEKERLATSDGDRICHGAMAIAHKLFLCRIRVAFPELADRFYKVREGNG